MSSSPNGMLSSILSALRGSFTSLQSRSHTPENDGNSPHNGILRDIQRLGFKDYETLGIFLSTSAKGINDDNKLLVERLVQLLSKLPPQSKELKQLSDGFIDQLWNTLDHPPASSLGDQYQYRQADGSHNNINDPQLGAANRPYARSVRPTVFQNPDLPDPGTIFDKLMARGDTFEPHPQGLSSMLPYLATIIIHDIFQTSPTDHNNNMASSYLDLSSLYGRNLEEVRAMRTFKHGQLKRDCFSSARLLGFPPGCGIYLIMFNRFHNYVVTQLALINESGRFTKPRESDKGGWTRYDEELFQTGRLVTSGIYINIVLKDFVRTILALNRANTTWSLDPRAKEGKTVFSKGVPAGTGNMVSAEFNLLYRWHSTISPKDEEWAIAEFKRLLKGKNPETASHTDVLGALALWQAAMPPEPEARIFENLKRLPDGTLSDDDLVKILTGSINDVAGSFGANKVPRCMKSVEVLGILQARGWDLGTLNEFREFVGLAKHATFEDINPDPEVASRLKQLYDTPDRVEIYPGIIAEKTKPPMSPGSGLCGTVTMTTAILSDAVALVRGDRFYTIDYTPKLLTNWGFNEVDCDSAVDGGHVLHKLIFRAFPNHFVNNSVYAHFPLVTPAENEKVLKGLGKKNQYNWETPHRRPGLTMIKSYKACTHILNNPEDFKVTWGEAINFLSMRDDGTLLANEFCLTGDRSVNASNRNHIQGCLYPANWEKEINNFFSVTTDRLLVQYGDFEASQTGLNHPNASHGVRTHEVDIVRDVIALTTARFSAALWSLPLRTQANPQGVYSDQELYLVLLGCFAAIFFDADIGKSFTLRSHAREWAQHLGRLIMSETQSLQVSTGNSFLNAVAETLEENLGAREELKSGKNGEPRQSEWPALGLYGDHMIKRMMMEAGRTLEEVVWGSILPASVAGCANQTEALSQAIDYYLGDGKPHLPAMYTLAHAGTAEADEQLKKYFLEGVRLRGAVAVFRELASDQTIHDFSPSMPNSSDPSGLHPLPTAKSGARGISYNLRTGSRIIVNLTTANHDATVFPDPETVRLDRPVDSYIHFGWGPHLCLGKDMSIAGLSAMFKKIVGLKNLRRAPGGRGVLKSFPAAPWNGQVGAARNPDAGWTGLRTYMTADQSAFWPVPSTLRVLWDE
ncbi:hypothetical protein VMCG_05543 [Cytospora schulzeri]|uniref:linoleate 8R-lipoxygenase n=1 Tax=Cytospora schulzeri TaxID=448051 RepID=A0A423WFF2_9PEZI|nr:hypothetical protein VMCG_05543 [Valsa malicola]